MLTKNQGLPTTQFRSTFKTMKRRLQTNTPARWWLFEWRVTVAKDGVSASPTRRVREAVEETDTDTSHIVALEGPRVPMQDAAAIACIFLSHCSQDSHENSNVSARLAVEPSSVLERP